MVFDCPLPAALSVVPAADSCPTKIDQIVRCAFMRIRPGQAPAFALAAMKTKAAWVTALAETGDKKIVVSPIFSNLTIPASEGQTEGGNDNSTPFGTPDYLGETAVTVPLQFRNLSFIVEKALRKFSQESRPTVGAYSLGLFLFTKNGQILCAKTTATVGNNPLAILNWRVGTRGTEGFNKNDIVPASFTLAPYWSEDAELVTPTDFNPLFDL